MPKRDESRGSEISLDISLLKKRWSWIVLISIILFGLYFRYYHVDYPVIGYHNWKESRYLQEARNFAEEGFFKYGFFVAAFDYPPIHDDPSGAHSGEFPALSILIAMLFKMFGMSLYIARLAVLLFGLGAIIMMYLLVKELFGREDLALPSASAAAVMPLLVFFTHNVDIINLGLFFMLLGAYFYVLWVKHSRARDMILASLFIMIAGASKYEFLAIGIPMLFIFPWSRLNELRKFSAKYYSYIMSALIFALVPAQYFYSLYISRKTGSSAVTAKLIDTSVIFTSQWWTAMKSYTADNYTLLGFYIALFGIAFFLLSYQKKSIGYKFTIGYLIGTILYFIILSKKLGGHSYHQYPVAPFFAIMIAYCFVFVATNISNAIKFRQLKPVIVIVLFLILYFPSANAWERQFDTQFFGLDIAGDYINKHSTPNQRIIHSGHQDYGVFWHADRKGIDGGIPNASEIKWAEDNLNVTWIFVYQWGLSVMREPDKWNHIKDNYRLRQIAFINQQPFYLLFSKGGKFNESMLQNLTGLPQRKTYELTSGNVAMQWMDFE